MTGQPIRAILRLVPDEPDQVLRLARFRQDHPDVVIGDAGFGAWEARIPEPAGETVTVRYTLRELLDRLDELTAQPGGAEGDLPGGSGCGRPGPRRRCRR